MFLFMNGSVVGADLFGAKFDGRYRVIGENCLTTIGVTVPPGTQTIQGISTGDKEIKYDVEITIPVPVDSVPYSTVKTPFGLVNIRLKKLRDV